MQTKYQHTQQAVATPAAIPPAIDPPMRLPAVESAVGMKRTFIYDGIKRGTFPKPVRIGGQSVAWRQSDIAAWINSRDEVAL